MKYKVGDVLVMIDKTGPYSYKVTEVSGDLIKLFDMYHNYEHENYYGITQLSELRKLTKLELALQ